MFSVKETGELGEPVTISRMTNGDFGWKSQDYRRVCFPCCTMIALQIVTTAMVADLLHVVFLCITTEWQFVVFSSFHLSGRKGENEG